MPFSRLEIPDVVLYFPDLSIDIKKDERGFLLETYRQADFETYLGRSLTWAQENLVFSKKNVLRGLHYQAIPHAQGKLVSVVRGTIFDVAIDLRGQDPRWVSAVLSEHNRAQLWIPEGYAHGFLTLSKESVVLYKMTKPYVPEHEESIFWNDPSIAVKWPLRPGDDPVLSEKDKKAPPLKAI